MRLFSLLSRLILSWIFRFCLFLRYRIEVKGFSKIIEAKEKGILFLPNHPAQVDPLILINLIWPKFRVRPLVVEHFYYLKGFRFFMDLVRVLPIPSIEQGNRWKEQQVEKVKRTIIEGLDKSENFLIYPSGRLKLTGEEIVGGASLVFDLLQKNPEIKIVLIRTTGLWGSTFSRAITGVSPEFGKTLWEGIKTVLKNGIFFTPRRKITIEMEFAPEDFPRKAEKMTINKWLEGWYNQKGAEPLTLVSFLFWRKKFPEITAEKKEKIDKPVTISEEKKKQILEVLSKIAQQPIEKITPNQHLSNDLGLDSIDIGQIHVFLEERFNIPSIAPGELQTVQDLFEAASGTKEEALSTTISKKKSKWPREPFRPIAQIPSGETIFEVFLKSCDRMGDTTACADGIVGVLSYQKLKLAALVLSLKIRSLPGENIGILLPSTVAAYSVILAIQLAGKIPVMLNWTAGFRNIEHAVDTCKIQAILSSYRFLSRAESVDVGKADDCILFLEELRREISFGTKLKGYWMSLGHAKKILQRIPINEKNPERAVIIFTSGTETLPKAVPLSHQNILKNQKAALECVTIYETDILYGVLPPFHSFGFSVTGLFPLLAGVKVCYAPDPTDSRSLANDIEHWKPTLFCCAPSFIQGLLRVARNEQLESLRIVVSGAEKTPQELFDAFHAKGKVVLEGYGISECSPIVTLDREREPHKGVGKPIPGTELSVIDLENQKPLEIGKEGEICIAGPGVFSGYLDIKKDPFIEFRGKKWYRSGDQGYLDQDGTLFLTGRLKRFVKIGGEMVSLGGLEEDIKQICIEKNWLPEILERSPLAIASKGSETEKPLLILFCIKELDRDAINQALKELGHGRLIKIQEIRKIEEIPLTATGKIHYRLLDETL